MEVQKKNVELSRLYMNLSSREPSAQLQHDEEYHW